MTLGDLSPNDRFTFASEQGDEYLSIDPNAIWVVIGPGHDGPHRVKVVLEEFYLKAAEEDREPMPCDFRGTRPVIRVDEL